MLRLGTYDKEKASTLKIGSGNFPGHGKITPPPPEARVGYGIYDGEKWVGFVEMTHPYADGELDKTSAYVGVGLLPEYRKRGLAREAVAALMREMPEVRKWKWSFVSANKDSRKLGEQLGFSGLKKGETMDTLEKLAASIERVRAHTRKVRGKPVPVKEHTRAGEEPRPEEKPTLAQMQSTEMQLWWRWKLGGQRPEDLRPLVRSMMSLVNRQASVYIGKVQMPPEAIRAEFTKHLILGLKAYSPDRGTSLSTFATWYMKKAQRYITTYQNTARIPEDRIYKIRKFEQAREALREELNREPSDKEMARKLGWLPKDVILLDTELRRDLSTSKFETDPTVVMPSRELEILKLFPYELEADERELYKYLTGMGRPRITDTKRLVEKLGDSSATIFRRRAAIAIKLKTYIGQYHGIERAIGGTPESLGGVGLEREEAGGDGG